MTGREMKTGPTGDTVRANIAMFRSQAGMTYAALSKKLGALGRSIPPLGLRRIESGDRRVDVDDLTALAIALDVNPHAILLPRTSGEGVPARVTGGPDWTSSERIWQWAQGWAGIATLDPSIRERVRPHRLLDRDQRAWARKEWLTEQVARIRESHAEQIAEDELRAGGPVDVYFSDDGLIEEYEALDPFDDAAWAGIKDDPAPPAMENAPDPRNARYGNA